MESFNWNIRIYSNIRIYLNIRICFTQYKYIHIRIRMKIFWTNIFVFGPEKKYSLISAVKWKIVIEFFGQNLVGQMMKCCQNLSWIRNFGIILGRLGAYNININFGYSFLWSSTRFLSFLGWLGGSNRWSEWMGNFFTQYNQIGL